MMSPEGRARIAAAQKARWAKQKKNKPPRQENLLMTVTVAGFENHYPVVYIVQRGVDWKQLRVREPSSRRVYPDDSRGRKVTLQGTTNKGVSDLYKGATTTAIREEMQRLPLEYKAMSKYEDLTREQLFF
jgi:hypothetical protein